MLLIGYSFWALLKASNPHALINIFLQIPTSPEPEILDVMAKWSLQLQAQSTSLLGSINRVA